MGEVGYGPGFINASPAIHTRDFGAPALRQKISTTSPANTDFKPGLNVYQSVTSRPDWTNLSAETLWTIDSAHAAVVVSPGQFSETLFATGVGLKIPTDAHIQGITVRIDIELMPNVTTYVYVGLTLNGTTVQTSKVLTDPYADTFYTLGDSGDDWGRTWTVAELEAATFGITVEVEKSLGSQGTFSVNAVDIRVHYTFSTVHVRAFGLPSVGQSVVPTSVVHTRAIGTPTLGVGAVAITTPSVLHTSAIGSPTVQIPTNVFPPSVVHTRAFGNSSLGPPSNNPDMKQGSVNMDWLIETFEDEVINPKIERV